VDGTPESAVDPTRGDGRMLAVGREKESSASEPPKVEKE